MECLSDTPEGVVINVRAQPRSSRAGIDSLIGDAVKVRVRCAPVDGKANKELIETLADAFGICSTDSLRQLSLIQIGTNQRHAVLCERAGLIRADDGCAAQGFDCRQAANDGILFDHTLHADGEHDGNDGR